MIDVTELDVNGAPWFEVWFIRDHRHVILASDRSREQVLIWAEKAIRRDLDDVQAKLTAERERLKRQARA